MDDRPGASGDDAMHSAESLEEGLPDLSYLESLVSDSGGVVWEFNWSTGAFTYVSASVADLLGYPREAWLAPRFWLERLHPDDAEWAPQYCQRCTADRKNHQFSYRMIHANGSVVWVNEIVSVDVDKGLEGCLRGLMIDITEQKRIEERLDASDQHFRDITSKVGLLAVQLDAAGTITWANEPAQRLLAQQGDLIGRYFISLLEPDQRERAAAAFNERVGAGGSTGGFELPVRAADGSRRIVRWNSTNLYGTHGALTGVVSIGEDVTERAAFEREIARKAEEFDAIFTLSRDLFFRMNAAGYITAYSAPNERDLYAPPSAFLHRRYTEALPPHLAEVLRSGVSDCHATGALVTLTYQMQIGDRQSEWEARFLPLRDGDTAIITRDITETVAARRALTQSRDRLADLLGALDCGVILVDGATGDLKLVNRPTEALFGYEHDELLGRTTRVLHVSDEAYQRLNVSIADALQAGDLYATELTLVRKDGSRFTAEVSVRSLSGPGGDRLGTIRDISSRKAADEILRDSEQRMRSIVMSAPFGMLFFRVEDDRLLFAGANAAADRLLGTAHADLVGSDAHDVFPLLEEETEILQALRRVAREGGAWHADTAAFGAAPAAATRTVDAFQVRGGEVAVAFTEAGRDAGDLAARP